MQYAEMHLQLPQMYKLHVCVYKIACYVSRGSTRLEVHCNFKISCF